MLFGSARLMPSVIALPADNADASVLHACCAAALLCCAFAAEPLDEPPKLLQQVLAEQQLEPSSFVTLRHGAMLQTADGVDLNSPSLLPLSAAE
jgi:hypothetical protein